MRPISLDQWRLLLVTTQRFLAERILPRHVFETRLRIRLQRGSQKLTVQGWARDLSESGLSAFVAQALLVGEFVTLEIPLTRSGTHEIPARVVRSLGTEYGFQFTALSIQQRALIRATLKGQTAIPYHGAEP
jgi:hypothetical protein